MPAVRPMLRAVGHGVPTAHGPKWADSCGSRWEQRVLLRPPVDEQLGRNALREVRESDHPMTTPDPLALAEEAERLARAATPGALTVERYDHGGGRMSVQDANRRHLVADTYHEGDRELFAVARDSMLTLAAALRAAHEENRRLREATGGLVPPRWASLVEVSDEIAAELLAAPSRPVTVRLERRDDGRLEVLFQQHECTPTPDPRALAAALRAAHEENRRIREALKGLRAEMPNRCTCAEDYTERDMIDPACNYHDYGGWALRVIDAALAGGKGEG